MKSLTVHSFHYTSSTECDHAILQHMALLPYINDYYSYSRLLINRVESEMAFTI